MCLHNSIHLTGNLCKRQIQIKRLNTYLTTMHLIYIVRLDFFFRLRVKKHTWNCILFFSKLIAAVFYIGKNLIQNHFPLKWAEENLQICCGLGGIIPAIFSNLILLIQLVLNFHLIFLWNICYYRYLLVYFYLNFIIK